MPIKRGVDGNEFKKIFLNRSFFEPFEIYDVAARKKKAKKNQRYKFLLPLAVMIAVEKEILNQFFFKT